MRERVREKRREEPSSEASLFLSLRLRRAKPPETKEKNMARFRRSVLLSALLLAVCSCSAVLFAAGQQQTVDGLTTTTDEASPPMPPSSSSTSMPPTTSSSTSTTTKPAAPAAAAAPTPALATPSALAAPIDRAAFRTVRERESGSGERAGEDTICLYPTPTFLNAGQFRHVDQIASPLCAPEASDSRPPPVARRAKSVHKAHPRGRTRGSGSRSHSHPYARRMKKKKKKKNAR